MRRILLVLAVVLAVAGPTFAQTTPPPILVNPDGVLTLDSPDHGKAASYRVGWFRLDTDAEPAVAETVPVSAVTVPSPGALTGLGLRAQTRPPFARYVMRVKLVATQCDPGYCESSWTDPATWSKEGATGTWLAYLPRRAGSLVIK